MQLIYNMGEQKKLSIFLISDKFNIILYRYL